MIYGIDADFRYSRGKEENPSRFLAERERSILPFFVEPEPSLIWGVDTSHWDGNVDFSVTAAAGARFAFIKCMDGTVPTPYFLGNLANAVDAGLLASGYAWLYPDRLVSASLQARRVAELTESLPMTMPLVIDFEWTRYAGDWVNPNFDDLRKWAVEYNRLTGKKAILYSAAGFMNLWGVMPADLRELFFGWWWASYGGSSPLLPLGFNDWDCWQFTANGDALKLAPGDKGKRELDLNYMKAEFYKKIGGTVQPTPTPVPTPGDTMKYKVIWSKGVAKRLAPHTGTSSEVTYTGLTLPFDAVVDVVQDNIPDRVDPTNVNKSWVKLAEKTLDGKDLYAAADYPDSLGVPRMRMVKLDEPTPEPTPGKVVKAVLYDDAGNVVEELFTKTLP